MKPAAQEIQTSPFEQMEKLKKEVGQVQEKYQEFEISYVADLLNLAAITVNMEEAVQKQQQ